MSPTGPWTVRTRPRSSSSSPSHSPSAASSSPVPPVIRICASNSPNPARWSRRSPPLPAAGSPAAWCRLPGLYDGDDLKDAAGHAALPAAEPARPGRPPRPRPGAEDQPDLALERRLPGLLDAAVRPARTRLNSHPVPATRKGGRARRSRSRYRPGHTGQHRHPPGTSQPDKTAENRLNTISNQPRLPLNHRGITVICSRRERTYS